MKRLVLFFCLLLSLCACRGGGGEEILPEPELLTGICAVQTLSLPEGFANESARNVLPSYDPGTGRILAYGAKYAMEEDGYTVRSVEHAVFSAAPGGEWERVCSFSYSDAPYESVEAGVFADGVFWFLTADSQTMGDWTLRRCSLDTGKVESSEPINRFFDASSGFFHPDRLAVDGAGNVYAAHGAEVAVFDPAFLWLGTIPTDGTVASLAADGDGAVWACRYGQMAKIGTDGGKPVLGETVTLPPKAASVWFAPGHDLYYGDLTHVWGLDLGEETGETVYSASASGFLSDELQPVGVADAETILFLDFRDGKTYNPGFALGMRQPDLDLEDVELLRVAVLSYDQKLEDMTVRFRREHPEILVLTEEYSPVYAGSSSVPVQGEDYSASDALLFDILNGGYRPDVICSSDGEAAVGYLAGHDMLADLKPLLGDGWDDLFGCVKNAYSDENGRLWGLCGSFTASVTVGGPDMADYVDGWTAGEILDYAMGLPEGEALRLYESKDFFDGTKAFLPVLYECVDMEKGKADFDKPVFEQLLSYLDTLPAAADLFGMSPMDFFREKYVLTLDGRVKIQDQVFFGEGMKDWLGLEAAFDTEDYVILTEKLSDGRRLGGISAEIVVMAADCGNPDGAWAFIRFLTAGENGWSEWYPDEYDGFPAWKSVFDDAAARLMDGYEYYMDYGQTAGRPSVYKVKAGEGKPAALTDPFRKTAFTSEKAAQMRQYFDVVLADTVKTQIPEAIREMVREEISAYLGGARTAGDCAKICASRTALWLAENH